jgi:hypothetical protein
METRNEYKILLEEFEGKKQAEMRVYRLRLQKHFKFDQGELSVAL